MWQEILIAKLEQTQQAFQTKCAIDLSAVEIG